MHDKFFLNMLDWQNLCRGPLDIRSICYNLMVVEKIFLCFFHYKSIGVIDPQGVASLDSRGLISRIHVVEH